MAAIVPEKIVPSVIGQVEIEFARDKNVICFRTHISSRVSLKSYSNAQGPYNMVSLKTQNNTKFLTIQTKREKKKYMHTKTKQVSLNVCSPTVDDYLPAKHMGRELACLESCR